ncbi:hypothetical protein BU24DRAFT_261983 [Aaosphaeria arxii CBS 175.79]|uniref:Uncharacterized protein n=1 Tax=Aaosphaeria arxii CBS 175.79 TaxID=1450172 RepID=A0A6A5XKY4_9PLEO|nr:uncharacterized protein BU24DRAFT_261983 [Aaosphaeria arxii CBS 175.79]KAF2012954.1 hypothetical protein BU24DRAFT_261983 [Aaosphaeria arxii CBS 175.79]
MYLRKTESSYTLHSSHTHPSSLLVILPSPLPLFLPWLRKGAQGTTHRALWCEIVDTSYPAALLLSPPTRLHYSAMPVLLLCCIAFASRGAALTAASARRQEHTHTPQSRSPYASRRGVDKAVGRYSAAFFYDDAPLHIRTDMT